MDALDIALGEFGQSLGIDDLSFGEDDECQLEIGGTFLDLLADRSGQRLVLSALVGELPDRDRTAVLLRLLDANCHPAMAGSTIGVPAGSSAVIVIDQIMAQGLNGQVMAAVMEGYLAAVDHARGVLGASTEARDAVATSPRFEADTVVLRL